LPHMETRIKKDFYCSVSVVLGLNGISDDEIRGRLEGTGVKVQRVSYDYDLAGQRRTLQCEIKLRRNDVPTLSRQVVASLTACPGVVRVTWD